MIRAGKQLHAEQLIAFRGETGRKVSLHLTAGITEITWRDDDEMLILGGLILFSEMVF